MTRFRAFRQRAVFELKSLLAEENTRHPGTTVCQEEESEPVSKKGKKTLSSFFKKTALSGPQSEEENIKTELSSYLMMSPDTDSDKDPLEWWMLHEANFPRLSKLAKKYLCIPATSAPSDRVFSTGGNIVTCHRACLKPESVDRLVLKEDILFNRIL
jgi:hypothetical protein